MTVLSIHSSNQSPAVMGQFAIVVLIDNMKDMEFRGKIYSNFKAIDE